MQQEQTDNHPQKIGFALAQITTEQFAVIEDSFDDKSEIKIQINLRFAADNIKKIVGVFSSFAFETNGKHFLIIEAGCHFIISPESWGDMINDVNTELTVGKGFLQHMAVITVGTTRGILHSKTENTCFNKYHLPTINVAKMISDDRVFKFDNID